MFEQISIADSMTSYQGVRTPILFLSVLGLVTLIAMPAINQEEKKMTTENIQTLPGFKTDTSRYAIELS